MQSDGRNVQGAQLFQEGQYHAAIQNFQKAISTDPSNSDGYYNLAATYHRMGRMNANQALLNQAESLYNQCLEYDPNHADCHRGLAVLLVETSRPDAAFRLLEGWATRQPQTADAKIELARLYEEFGDKETAKSHLEEALVADTTSTRAWTALGKLREESGDYAQALANYQRSYQLNNLQPAIASRIAALNSGLRAGTGLTPPGGTRIVTQPGPANR